MKTYIALVMDCTVDVHDDTTMHLLGDSPMITDSKGLYDASRPPTARLAITEKRPSIEVTIVNERMKAAERNWTWTNSQQQINVGPAKEAARQHFAEVLRKSRHAIKHDASFTGGKKLTSEQRKDYETNLEEEAHVAEPEVILEEQRCCKPGCLKCRHTGGHRHCTHRHCYSDSNRIAAAAVIAQATNVDATFAGNVQIYFVIDAGMIVKFALTGVPLILTVAAHKVWTGRGYPAAACVDDADTSTATTTDYHRCPAGGVKRLCK
jgi:hypothetical protein